MKNSGFTLIELVMVLAIIGILSLVSYPLYSEHLTRVRRVYMVTTLLDVAGQLEKYYAENNAYEGVTPDNLLVNRSRYREYYDLEITPHGDLYTLKAIPIGNQKKDLACGTLTLDQDGNQGSSGTEDSSKCWL